MRSPGPRSHPRRVFLLYYRVQRALYFRFFFFSSRRRHTRSLRDWSSDVCSSDLARSRICTIVLMPTASQSLETSSATSGQAPNAGTTEISMVAGLPLGSRRMPLPSFLVSQIGRASCRERVGGAVVAVCVRREREY